MPLQEGITGETALIQGEKRGAETAPYTGREGRGSFTRVRM